MSEDEDSFTTLLNLINVQEDLRNLATSEYLQLIEQYLKKIKQPNHIVLIQKLLESLREVQQCTVENQEIRGKIIPVHFEILLALINKDWRDLYKCLIKGYCSTDNTTFLKSLITFLELITSAIDEIHMIAIDILYHQMSRVPNEYSASAIKGTYDHNRDIVISEMMLTIKNNKLVLDLLGRCEIKYAFFLDLDGVYKDKLFSKEEFKKFVMEYYSLEERPKLFKKYRLQ